MLWRSIRLQIGDTFSEGTENDIGDKKLEQPSTSRTDENIWSYQIVWRLSTDCQEQGTANVYSTKLADKIVSGNLDMRKIHAKDWNSTSKQEQRRAEIF